MFFLTLFFLGGYGVARFAHSSVVLSDGAVLVMGGYDNISSKNDVWKTADGGASWIKVTSSAGWTGSQK